MDEESLRLGAGARESPILVVDRDGGSQVDAGHRVKVDQGLVGGWVSKHATF